MIYAYLNTGNPVFPIFFTPDYQPSSSLSLALILEKTYKIFIAPSDPISPLYFISIPLIILHFRKSFITILLAVYVVFYVATLYLTPIESSSRFILPYLPAFTLLFLLILKDIKNRFLYNLLLIVTILVALSSIAYRGMANKRFIPYLLGKTTLSEFMTKNMEFQVGNFFDTDGYFKKTITSKDRVLIYNISNLFYINFPYIHESRAKKDDKFNYILIKNMELPEKFKNWKLVYQNPLTRIKLYSFSTQKK